MNLAQHGIVAVLQVYRWILSPAKNLIFGPLGRCRFTPSCSDYALEAVRRHGACRGGWLALRRLTRCHPWGDCGHDPVPPVSPRRATERAASRPPANPLSPDFLVPAGRQPSA